MIMFVRYVGRVNADLLLLGNGRTISHTDIGARRSKTNALEQALYLHLAEDGNIRSIRGRSFIGSIDKPYRIAAGGEPHLFRTARAGWREQTR